MSKVSIIVPNYNHARFLPQRLDSIFDQTYQDFEVILLDDYSTDNSVEILKEYAWNPKVSKLIINKKNSGSPFIQWKKGVELAKGEYIWIAESDDWAENTFLEKTIAHIKPDKSISLVYGKSIVVDEKNNVLHEYSYSNIGMPQERWDKPFENDGLTEIKSYLYKRNTIPNASAVLFEKAKAIEVVDKISSFRMIGDWLFWILIIKEKKIIYDSSIINYFRTSSQTTRQHNTPEKLFNRYFENLQLNILLQEYKLIDLNTYLFINDKCVSMIIRSGYLNMFNWLKMSKLPFSIQFKVLKFLAWKVKKWVGMK